MGIPSLVTIVAENQRLSTVEAANFGAVKLLGWHEEMTVDSYVEAFRDMIQNPEILSTLQRKGYELVGREQNDSKEHPAVHLIKESSYF